jgi:hypothetical protein
MLQQTMCCVQTLHRWLCKGVATDPCPELSHRSYDVFLTKEVLMSVLKNSVETVESFKHFITRTELLRNDWSC